MEVAERHKFKGQEPPVRLATFADEPVYLTFSLDGVELDPVVERLDRGQAGIVCARNFELFYKGQMIGPAVLVLQDEGMVVVDPVVKSKNWPIVQVEFLEISETDRQMIDRFLCTRIDLRPPNNNRRPKVTAAL
jgi:hypothetical protein